MIKSKKQMYLVIGAFALVLMLGTVTYAFFNYTRTGSANTIRTGRIAFNSQQGNSINLTNVFPVDVSNGIPNNNPNVGSATINVTGDTTYGEGVEYLVSAVNVQNTIGSGANAKSLPISIDVSVASNSNNDPATALGTADSDYFTNRGSSANTSIYKVLASDVLANNEELLVGYIKSGATGVDGNIVIKAYIDASKIAITDTYPEGTVHTVKTTGYSSSACETALTGVANASTYCASASSLQSAIDGEDLTSAQITLLVNAGIVEEYTDGTTSSWVGDRTVLTTTEWNALQSSGVSFQIKVEANEGTWVIPSAITITYNANGGTVSPASKTIAGDATTYGALDTPTKANSLFEGWYTAEIGGTKVESSTAFVFGTSPTTLYAHWEDLSLLPSTISSCSGCVYKFATERLYYNYGNEDYGDSETILHEGDYDTDYRTTIANSGKKSFLGLKLDENGLITYAYACAVKGEDPNKGTPYCIEGTNDISRVDEVVQANADILIDLYGEIEDPYVINPTTPGCKYYDSYPNVACSSSFNPLPNSMFNDYTGVDTVTGSCGVNGSGYALCG